MNYKSTRFANESKIINFFKNFNKNFLVFFFNSKIYRLFININTFFRKTILPNVKGSTVIKSARKITALVKAKDIGIFIILVVMFNALAMFGLKKEIDIFSSIARICFLSLGIFLIFKRR